MTRVKVFIDYQNAYMRAREVFGDSPSDHFTVGQFHPRDLGLLLTHLGHRVDPTRELAEVRVYRGEPDAQRSPSGQAACQRQVHQWGVQENVTPITRALRYRPTAWDETGQAVAWETREKGIDVLIAVDMLHGAVRGEYDVAILVSADTDLIPALEAVLDTGRRVEVAAWRPDTGWSSRLQVPGRNIWCHMLSRRDYEQVRDPTDYTRPRT